MVSRQYLCVLGSVLVAAGMLAAPPVPAAASSPPDHPRADDPPVLEPGAAGQSRFTLVTGDVVAFGRTPDGSPAGRVVHDAAPVGDVRFLGVGDRIYALPQVAMPLLATGQLDLQLFDLATLDRFGYADASTGGIPLIVGSEPGGVAPSAAALAVGATVTRSLPSIGARAVRVDKARAERFWDRLAPGGRGTARLASGVGRIWLDGRVEASLDTSVPAVGAPAAWQAGYDGTGTTIAVLDTGIDAGHPDFAGRIAATRSFVPGDDVHDDNGHGTHVASIAAGSGAAADGRYRGVAPGAELLIGKVLSDSGPGSWSWVIAGMEWAAAQGADVVNLSLGACCSDGTDPISQALNQLSETTGTLFVSSAGNEDGAPLSVGIPAAADRALAVSNVDHRAGFAPAPTSSRGPRLGDYGIKPDLAAPGTAIIAARAGGEPDPYVAFGGTSMAAPHVAGAAAVLAQQHPQWSAQRLADHLQSSARRMDGAVASTHGSGVVDVAAASATDVSASGDLYLGEFSPPDTPPAVTGEVLLRNQGDQPVTLDLAVDDRFERVVVGDYDEVRLPDGAVTVTPSQVTVPAGGTATAETRVDLTAVASGAYYGQVVARDRAGGEVAHTTIGWSEDFPRHALSVHGIERDGDVPQRFLSYAVASSRTRAHRLYLGEFDADGRVPVWTNLLDGSMTERLPADEYAVAGKLGGLNDPVFAGGWTVNLDSDQEVVLDAREARRIQIETPRPTATEIAWWGWRQLGPEGVFDRSWSVRPGETAYQLLPEHPNGDYRLLVNTRRVAPPLQLRSRHGPPVRLEPPLTRACTFCERALPAGGGYELADAGSGTPEELAGRDLTGKVALVREAPGSGGSGRSVDAEVAAVAQAGAVGMLLAVDAGDPVRAADAGNPIWSAVLTAGEGEALAARIARGRDELRARVNVPSPYVYDLYYPARRPRADGVYKIQQRDLATVHTRFHAPQPGTLLGEVSRYSFGWDGYPTGPLPTPFERTDYVVPDRARISTVSTRNLGDRDHEYVLFTPELRAGQRIVRDVGGAPMAPGPLRGNPLLVSTTDGLAFDTTHHGFEDLYSNYPWPLAASDGSGGLARGFTARTRVWRGDEVVCDRPEYLACEITGEGRHTITVDTSQDRAPLATRTTTEWTLEVRGPHDPGRGGDHLLPVAGWQPRLDLANTAPDRAHVVPLRVGYQPGAAGRSGWDVTAWVSFDDGDSWTRAYQRPVGRAGLAFVRVRPPADHHGYVSLRVRAADRHGNTVDQTIIRAYGLR